MINQDPSRELQMVHMVSSDQFARAIGMGISAKKVTTRLSPIRKPEKPQLHRRPAQAKNHDNSREPGKRHSHLGKVE